MKRLAVIFALFILCANVTFEAHAQKKIRLAIVVNSLSPFWDPMRIGMDKAAEELGVEVQWAGPANGQITEQRRLLEQFAAQGVDGIAVSPLDEKAITPVINDLMKRGVKIICMDNDCPDSERLAYIGTLNYEAGVEAGKAAVKLMPDGGKIIAFVGRLDSPNASQRLQGFVDATKDHGIEVLETRQDQTDKNRARRNVEDVLQAFPDIDGLLGLWSYNGPAIAQAVQSAKRKDSVKIITFDAEPQTIMHLKKSEIDATVVQKPYFFGKLSVLLLHDIIKTGEDTALRLLPPNKIIDTGVDIITPDNVTAYEDGLKELGIKSS